MERAPRFASRTSELTTCAGKRVVWVRSVRSGEIACWPLAGFAELAANCRLVIPEQTFPLCRLTGFFRSDRGTALAQYLKCDAGVVDSFLVAGLFECFESPD